MAGVQCSLGLISPVQFYEFMTKIVEMLCDVDILQVLCRITAVSFLPDCIVQEIISCQILIKLL